MKVELEVRRKEAEQQSDRVKNEIAAEKTWKKDEVKVFGIGYRASTPLLQSGTVQQLRCRMCGPREQELAPLEREKVGYEPQAP